MTINEREDQNEPPHESSARDDDALDLNLRPIQAEETLAINRRLLIFIERKNEERRSLAEQFDKELGSLFSPITLTDCKFEEEVGHDPADWPAF